MTCLRFRSDCGKHFLRYQLRFQACPGLRCRNKNLCSLLQSLYLAGVGLSLMKCIHSNINISTQCFCIIVHLLVTNFNHRLWYKWQSIQPWFSVCILPGMTSIHEVSQSDEWEENNMSLIPMEVVRLQENHLLSKTGTPMELREMCMQDAGWRETAR